MPCDSARAFGAPTGGNSERCLDLFTPRGFSKKYDACAATQAETTVPPATMRCHVNPATQASACFATSLLLRPGRVKMSKGGEPINDVLGRGEREEFPRYEQGAFELTCKRADGFKSSAFQHHIRDITNVLSFAPQEGTPKSWGTLCHPSNQNVRYIKRPTVLTTRYDYANIYLTMSDLYGAFTATALFREELGLAENEKAQLLILDGHSQGHVDDLWAKFFDPMQPDASSPPNPTNLPYLAHVVGFDSRPVCFERAVIAPAGYKSAIFGGSHGAATSWTMSCGGSDMLRQFSDAMVSRYGIALNPPSLPEVFNILVVFRKGYLAHPRIGNRLKKPSRVITNEEETVAALRAIQLTDPDTNELVQVAVRAAYFEDLTLEQQIAAARPADLMIGMHGAGLCHALFMRKGRALLELMHQSYADRRTYEFLSHWNGMAYRTLMVPSPSHDAFKTEREPLQRAVHDLACSVLATRKQERAQVATSPAVAPVAPAQPAPVAPVAPIPLPQPTPSTTSTEQLTHIEYPAPTVSSSGGEAQPCAGVVDVPRPSPDATMAQRCNNLFTPSGFTKRIEVCTPTEEPSERVRAASLTPSNMVCDVHEETGASTCLVSNLLVVPENIRVSKGGEAIDAVMGRSEREEFPNYRKDTFTVTCERASSYTREPFQHHVKDMTAALAFRELPQAAKDWGTFCHPTNPNIRYVKEPVVLTTRYDYANIYLTMSDVYGAFIAVEKFRQELGLKGDQKPLLVLLDGHSQGHVDDLWGTFFDPLPLPNGEKPASLPYVAQVLGSKPVCFERAVIAPAGYKSAIFGGSHGAATSWTMSCGKSDMLRGFADILLWRYNVELQHPSYVDPRLFNVLVVFRKGYVAHPRIGQRAKRASRTITNEKQVVAALEALKLAHPVTGQAVRPRVQVAYFEDMSLREQIMTARPADVMLGMHGAGLCHALFMRENTALLEFMSGAYSSRKTYEFLTRWVGVFYRTMAVRESGSDAFEVEPAALQAAVKELACKVLKRRSSLER